MAKVRLADIAAQVGVSTVTVHNALTGQKGVSDELRAVRYVRWYRHRSGSDASGLRRDVRWYCNR